MIMDFDLQPEYEASDTACFDTHRSVNHDRTSAQSLVLHRLKCILDCVCALASSQHPEAFYKNLVGHQRGFKVRTFDSG